MRNLQRIGEAFGRLYEDGGVWVFIAGIAVVVVAFVLLDRHMKYGA